MSCGILPSGGQDPRLGQKSRTISGTTFPSTDYKNRDARGQVYCPQKNKKNKEIKYNTTGRYNSKICIKSLALSPYHTGTITLSHANGRNPYSHGRHVTVCGCISRLVLAALWRFHAFCDVWLFQGLSAVLYLSGKWQRWDTCCHLGFRGFQG